MKKEKKKIRINVRLSERDYESFKVFAEELGVSLSELMRIAVLEKKKEYCLKYLEKYKSGETDITRTTDWLNSK